MTLSDAELHEILGYVPQDKHPKLLMALGYAAGIDAARKVRAGAPSMRALGANVTLVRELYATGRYSHRTLAAELNARGIPSAKGGKWWPTTVLTALAAPL